MKSLLLVLVALTLVGCSKEDTSHKETQPENQPQLEMVVIPPTLHFAPEIDCGPRPYVCFRYQLMPGNQVNFGAMPILLAADRTVFGMSDFCEFKAHLPSPSLKVHINQRQSGYRLDLDVIEGEITCNGVATPQSDFLSLIARDISLNANTNRVDGGTVSRVQISRGDIYLLGDSRFFRLKATSITGNDMAGTFAAVAKRDNDEHYMIIFDGKFDVTGGQ